MIKSSKGLVELDDSSKVEIMADLACIVKSMKEKFGEEDVREAVEYGLKSDEEIALLLLEKMISILRGGGMSKNDIIGGIIAAVIFAMMMAYIIFRLLYVG